MMLRILFGSVSLVRRDLIARGGVVRAGAFVAIPRIGAPGRRAESSSSPASGGASAGLDSTSEPYFITEAPAEPARAAPTKWGRATIKAIRGHTKKLSPLARQVRAFHRGAKRTRAAC